VFMKRRRKANALLALATVTLIVFSVAASACGQEQTGGSSPVPAAPTSESSLVATPPTLPSSSPSASPTLLAARSFASDGIAASGWFWLRDAAHEQTALWVFNNLSADRDVVVRIDVLAAGRLDGPGVPARFYLSWTKPGPGGLPGPWIGHLFMQLPNTGGASGHACTGTVTIPRAPLGNARLLIVQVSRDDPYGKGPSSDVQVAVRKTSLEVVR
jgi:hypothetical protein